MHPLKTHENNLKFRLVKLQLEIPTANLFVLGAN